MRLFLKAYPFFFFIFLLQNTCTVHAKQPKSLFFKIDLKKNIVHFGYFLTKDHHLKVVETNILTQYDENEVQRIIEQQIDATLTQHKALIFIHGMWGNKKRFLNDNIFDFEKDYGTANDVIVHIIWDAKSVNVATCRRHARKSTPFVTAILRGVLQMNDVSPTLMCHSMGNYLFFEMMDSLQKSPQPFEQILLVAADVSLPVFEKKLDILACVGKTTRVFYNKNDVILLLSGIYNREPRLGRKSTTIQRDFITKTDCTKVKNKGFRGKMSQHLYFKTSPVIRELLKKEINS